MSRLQDIFKDESNFDPEKDCASVNIYIAYLFYFISASIVFILYVLVLTCYQQKTVRKTGQWDSNCMVIENDKVGTDANLEYDPQNDEIFPLEFCTGCRTGGITGLRALLHCVCLHRADSHVEPRVQMLGAQELCHQLRQHHLCGPASQPHCLLP